MSAPRTGHHSAFKSGVIHFALSVATFSGAAALAGGAIHMAGDVRDAGPSYELAVFDTGNDTGAPELKSRFAEREIGEVRMASLQPMPTTAFPADEPSLNVRYPGDAAEAQGASLAERNVIAVPASSPMRESVRINGRTVFTGESFSEVDTLGELPPSPISGLHDGGAGGRLPIIAEDGREIADAYARPFYSRSGQPTVSLVLGGLGINYTHTISAIEELPPEVTLSFAPHARGLQTWVKRARDAGHEVLIELPLEPHNHGRLRPHANTLQAGADTATNLANLENVLARVHGYFGVINYQGDKFAADPDASKAMFEALRARGVAFIEDGSLPGDGLKTAASETGARFAKADIVVDARMEADAMQSQLAALEAAALENGGALGTAIGYPLTIDIVQEWTMRLEDKGILLAPASSLQSAATSPQSRASVETLPGPVANLP